MSTQSGPKRIITIASGKGGVGKTTLAINYGLALSQYGKTALFDFDFETGSVRSFLDLNYEKDLYHFFRKETPLEECLTPVSKQLDPHGRFSNFGAIVAPRHFMEEIAHLKKAAQHKLIHAIHKLKVDYVIIDMKAGLDNEVIDFLPYSNSGILIFTPRLLAATSAAAYLVKAQIFRKLHLVFSHASPVIESLSQEDTKEIIELLHRADDVYDNAVPNLDTVFDILEAKLGSHPVVTAMAKTIGHFRVHYVLNHFTGVEESYQNAVGPFVRHLSEIVSSRLKVRNLGWMQFHTAIHEANCKRIPVMLGGAEAGKTQDRKYKDALQQLENWAGELLTPPAVSENRKPGLDKYLADQLSQLETTYSRMAKRNYIDNFNYVAAASVHLMKTERAYNFGDTRIMEAQDLRKMIVDSYRKHLAGVQDRGWRIEDGG